MYNLAIRKCTTLPLIAPRLKIFKLKLNPGPAEPEADMLPSEPARRARFEILCRLLTPESKEISVGDSNLCSGATLLTNNKQE